MLRNWPGLRSLLILLIIPFITLLVTGSVLLNQRYAFMLGGDPMYAYLLNGLTLARGETDIGHTDNPGTTVQVYSAAVIRLVHLFRSNPSMTEDVIANPELYIYAGRIGLVLLMVVSLFFLGRTVYRVNGGKIIPALFLQLVTLTGVYTLIHSTAFAPEGLMMTGCILFLIVTMRYWYEQRTDWRTMMRYAIAFGISCGFLTVTKFPAIVFMAIPLAALPGIRARLIFLFAAFASAFVFILPAINRIGNFFGFINRILTHSGQYGTGKAEFLNWENFRGALEAQVRTDWFLTFVILFSLVIFIAGLFRYKSWFKPNLKTFMLLGGMVSAMLMNLVMASKHFNFYYLIPSQYLIIPSAYLGIQVLQERFSKSGTVFFPGLKIQIFILAVLPFFFFARFWKSYTYMPGFKQYQTQANSILFGAEKLPRIYVNSLANTAGPEPAFYFGWAYTGEIRTLYAEYIRKYYPDAFLFLPHENRYIDFGNTWPAEMIAREHPRYWFYILGQDADYGRSETKHFNTLRDSLGPVVRFVPAFYGDQKSEIIFEMLCDTARAKKMMPLTRQFKCDFERPAADTAFYTTDSTVFVKGIESVTASTAHSGKRSLYFPHKDNFAGEFFFPIRAGAVYEITVWRKSESSMGWITASAGANGEMYNSSAFVTGKTDGEWKEVRLIVSVPADFIYPQMRVILWNNDLYDREIWFDDIEVKEYVSRYK